MLTRLITPTKNSNAVLYLLNDICTANNTECDSGRAHFLSKQKYSAGAPSGQESCRKLQKSKEKLQIQNAKLEYDVYHDSLTEMNNRQLFWSDLNKTIEMAEKNNDAVTVMLFDLDRFKEVNDTYGHDAGDMLLRQISDRLISTSLTSDTLYRLGGDEFAFLSSGLTESRAVSRAQKICEFISQPYTIYNTIINITTCVGIVISENERRSDYLYKFADLALYEAKNEGSGKIKVFRQRMLEKLQESRTLEHDMALAIVNKEPWCITSLLSILSVRKYTAMRRLFVGSILSRASCRRIALFPLLKNRDD